MGSEYFTQVTIAQNTETLSKDASGHFFYIVYSWFYAMDDLLWVAGFITALSYIPRAPNKTRAIARVFAMKLFKLWPIYLMGILFYWAIAPDVLAGPFFGFMN
jgi:hypothetical protein